MGFGGGGRCAAVDRGYRGRGAVLQGAKRVPSSAPMCIQLVYRLCTPNIRLISEVAHYSVLLTKERNHGSWNLVAVSASTFLCGVALMYLVMMRTVKKRSTDGATPE